MKLTYQLVASMLKEWNANIPARDMSESPQLKAIQMLMEQYLAAHTLTWCSFADFNELLKPGQYHGRQENGYTDSYSGWFDAYWEGEHSKHETAQEAKAWVEQKAFSAGYGIGT